MKAIANVPWNENDVRVISHLIDMTLENKMAWDTLANLLKDLTTYDSKQVIDTLLKALEKLHLKTLPNNHDYSKNSLPDVDYSEDIEDGRFNEESTAECIGENTIVRAPAYVEMDSIIRNDDSVNEAKAELVEDDIELLELVKETIDEEIPSDMKEQTKNSVVKYAEYLSENIEQETHEIDNEWYTFVTNDKVNDARIVEQGKEKQQGLIDADGKLKTSQCTFCHKSFKHSSKLIQHERVHTGEAPYECKTCKKRFKQIHHLKGHESIHSGELPYECKICKKRFNQKFNLRSHAKIHTGKIPYECDTCKKRFKSKSNLKTHKRIHTGEVPYQCKTCKKRFKDKGALQKHERIHSGEKPYECKTCKKKFTQSFSLQIHERIHTGEVPLKCNRCNKRFGDPSNLRKHEKIHGK